MRRIGVRELRQDASRWLREVEAGESLEVTSRGRPVALLVPVPDRLAGLGRLIAEGRISRPTGDLLELGPALLPRPGVPLPGEVLRGMRERER